MKTCPPLPATMVILAGSFSSFFVGCLPVASARAATPAMVVAVWGHDKDQVSHSERELVVESPGSAVRLTRQSPEIVFVEVDGNIHPIRHAGPLVPDMLSVNLDAVIGIAADGSLRHYIIRNSDAKLVGRCDLLVPKATQAAQFIPSTVGELIVVVTPKNVRVFRRHPGQFRFEHRMIRVSSGRGVAAVTYTQDKLWIMGSDGNRHDRRTDKLFPSVQR